MGNRAVIAFGPGQHAPAVYLHWNGGLASVAAFLAAAKDLEIRDPTVDPTYATARFAQMIGNWTRGETGLGVGPLSRLDTDNGDNGLYTVGKGWKIIGRQFHSGPEERDAKKTAAIRAQVLQINRPLFVEDYKRRPVVELVDGESGDTAAVALLRELVSTNMARPTLVEKANALLAAYDRENSK